MTAVIGGDWRCGPNYLDEIVVLCQSGVHWTLMKCQVYWH